MFFSRSQNRESLDFAVRRDPRIDLTENPEVVTADDTVLRYSCMGKLFENICNAVQEERYLVSWHADVRCEERGVTDWQIVPDSKMQSYCANGRAASQTPQLW